MFFAITKVKFCSCFLKMWVFRASNEAEVLAIEETLQCLSRSFHGSLIVESHSSNVISWVSNKKDQPMKSPIPF